MRILHIAPSIARSYGGPTQSLSGYIISARLAGADVTVAAPAASPAETAEMESATGPGRVHTFSSFGRGAFVLSPSMVQWVRTAARKHDVVHVHGLFNPVSTLSCRAAIQEGAAVVLRPFGTLSRYTFEHRRNRLKRAYFGALERFNVDRASALHFTTSFERNEATWHNIDFGHRAHVVPPPWIGATTPVVHSAGDPVVLFIGRINRVKNIEALLSAWPRILLGHHEARLVIAGSGDSRYLASLRDTVTQLGISNRVFFPGFIDAEQKAEALGAATVLVLPSHHENFGVVVLEAIAAGIPVVVSPKVQIADFVHDNDFGIVTESSPPELASAINFALSDRALQHRVRELGHARVAETFAPEIIGKQLEQMYLRAIETRNARTSGIQN